jgi:hypothetical protein
MCLGIEASVCARVSANLLEEVVRSSDIERDAL